ELAATCIRACICHCYGTPVVSVVVCELIRNLITRPTHACACRVSALNHEFVNDPMENNSIIETFLNKFCEISCRNWHVFKQFDCYIAHSGMQDHFLSLPNSHCFSSASFLV